MSAGIPYSDIMSQYPDLISHKQLLSKHRRHFAEDIDISKSPVSDHGYIDKLKMLADAYLNKGHRGYELTLTQTRIVQAATNAVLYRKHVRDASSQEETLNQLLKEASQARWKYDDDRNSNPERG